MFEEQGSRATNRGGIETLISEKTTSNSSMTAFARATGLSRHTIMQICGGRLTGISGKTRSVIFAATGLEVSPFAEESGHITKPSRTANESSLETEAARIRAAADEIVKSASRIQSMSDITGGFCAASDHPTASQRVERVRQVLTALGRELGFFKEVDNEGGRELLRYQD